MVSYSIGIQCDAVILCYWSKWFESVLPEIVFAHFVSVKWELWSDITTVELESRKALIKSNK